MAATGAGAGMAERAGPAATYARLLGYARPYLPIGLLAVLGMTLEAAAAGSFTYLMQPLIDGPFVARDFSVTRWLPLAIIGLFLVRGVGTFLADYGMAYVGRNVVRTLREQLLAKLLRLPSAFFDAHAGAGLVSRLTYNTEQVAQASAEAIKIVITDVLTIAWLLAVMLHFSVRLTLTLLIVAPAIALIVYFVGRRYRRISKSIQSSVGDMAQAAEQAIAAQQTVKVYGGQDLEQERLATLARRNMRFNLKVVATSALSSSLVQFMAACALAAIIYVAGMEAKADRLSAGGFVALMTSMMAILPSLKRITNVQHMIQKGVAAATSLFEVIDAKPEADHGTRALLRAAGELEFRDVSVRYAPDRAAALAAINLRVPAGSVTALVGRSGSGKSTLVRLLPRLYEANQGSILLDSVELGEYRLSDLRAQIALVSQDVLLFDDSVARNIAYGALGAASDADIEAAAQAANAMEFIRLLPQGLHSRVGEGGALLSGGQRQRIAIARAILKNAPILILDEATSALDTESERLIQDALDRIMRGRTTLVIAHRLSTVEHADQVVVLDHGRIVEQGTHAELLRLNGQYAALHRLQFRDPG